MAMRSVRSSVAKWKGQISEFMERAWVEEMEKKGDKLPLIVLGAFVYGTYKGVSDIFKLGPPLIKEREELETLTKRCRAKSRAYIAKREEVVRVLTMVANKKADTK